VSLAARARRPALPVLALLLAACGGTASTSGVGATTSAPSSPPGSPSSGASAGASGTPSASATATGCGTGLQITVKGSTVTPAPGTTDVKAGCEVDLTITSDRTSEVHVHVVEMEKAITAGQPLHVTFTPTQPGVYEVELHDPDLLLVKLAVR